FQVREFEERFIALGLPYKVIGGPRFYERAEIRDALAYLRCIAQPHDELAFDTIYNQPKRGLGEATLAILHDYGRRAGLSLTRAARALVETEELKPSPRQILRGVLDDFDRWRRQSGEIPHEELAQLVLEESGYIDMWKAGGPPRAGGPLGQFEGTRPFDGRVSRPCGVSRTCLSGHGRRQRGRGRARFDHDPSCGEGTRV